MAVRCRTNGPTLKVHVPEPCGAERSHFHMQCPNIRIVGVQQCLTGLRVSCREFDQSQIRQCHRTAKEIIWQEGSISAVNSGCQTEQDSEGILQ